MASNQDEGPKHGAADPTPPQWWVHATSLERLGRIGDAERAILQNIDHLGAFATIASLHAERMKRLATTADFTGADAAYEAARDWIFRYAAGATSGGEGVAMSAERDRFLAELAAARNRQN